MVFKGAFCNDEKVLLNLLPTIAVISTIPVVRDTETPSLTRYLRGSAWPGGAERTHQHVCVLPSCPFTPTVILGTDKLTETSDSLGTSHPCRGKRGLMRFSKVECCEGQGDGGGVYMCAHVCKCGQDRSTWTTGDGCFFRERVGSESGRFGAESLSAD